MLKAILDTFSDTMVHMQLGHWKQERKQLFFPAVSSGFEHASHCSHAVFSFPLLSP